jgi:hypothetical protein
MRTIRTLSGERVDTLLHSRLVRACWFCIDYLENVSFKLTGVIALAREGMRNQALSATIGCRP